MYRHAIMPKSSPLPGPRARASNFSSCSPPPSIPHLVLSACSTPIKQRFWPALRMAVNSDVLPLIITCRAVINFTCIGFKELQRLRIWWLPPQRLSFSMRMSTSPSSYPLLDMHSSQGAEDYPMHKASKVLHCILKTIHVNKNSRTKPKFASACLVASQIPGGLQAPHTLVTHAFAMLDELPPLRAVAGHLQRAPGAPPEFPPHKRAASHISACPLHGGPRSSLQKTREGTCGARKARARPWDGLHPRHYRSEVFGALGGAAPPAHSSANHRRILWWDALPLALVEACTMHRLGQHRGTQRAGDVAGRKGPCTANMTPKSPVHTPKIQDKPLDAPGTAGTGMPGMFPDLLTQTWATEKMAGFRGCGCQRMKRSIGEQWWMYYEGH
ncbi:hypothetical protein K438DRAFT_1790319 [Mycena galopus ATCC 62051]|nr:hypothetical protein K438DRAFT_1790319 [Mycena galopus ATCC 62051]